MVDIEELQNYVPLNLLKAYEETLNAVLDADSPVRIISHYDADGLSAAALACIALRRSGKGFHLSVSHSLDLNRIMELKKENNGLIAFCDMGSGQVDMIEENLDGSTVVIFDHHYPMKESSKVFQVNPHFSDIDGTTEACASTVLFLFAIGLNAKNWDLYYLALSGAIGDKQHLGGLKGLNRKLLNVAVSNGIVKVERGFLLDSTPLSEALYESLEPYFTGMSGRKGEVEKFLKKLSIDGHLALSELVPEKRSELTSLLALRVLAQGAGRDIVEGLVAERYGLLEKKMDIREFSSYVNACGRMGREEIGIGYCIGDSESVTEAMALRKEYREKAREGLFRLEKDGTKKKKNIQYFYSSDPSIAGSHAGVGMMYFLDQEKPVLALSRIKNDVRVSTRGTNRLVSKGLDLASACRTVSEAVGGHGGGHDIAAGATIPANCEQEFLDRIDDFIGGQFETAEEQH